MNGLFGSLFKVLKVLFIYFIVGWNRDDLAIFLKLLQMNLKSPDEWHTLHKNNHIKYFQLDVSKSEWGKPNGNFFTSFCF